LLVFTAAKAHLALRMQERMTGNVEYFIVKKRSLDSFPPHPSSGHLPMSLVAADVSPLHRQ